MTFLYSECLKSPRKISAIDHAKELRETLNKSRTA
jgi:hypothetical protein